MLRLLIVEVSVSSPFTETSAIEALKADEYSFWVVLTIVSYDFLLCVNIRLIQLTWLSKQSVHSSLICQLQSIRSRIDKVEN